MSINAFTALGKTVKIAAAAIAAVTTVDELAQAI